MVDSSAVQVSAKTVASARVAERRRPYRIAVSRRCKAKGERARAREERGAVASRTTREGRSATACRMTASSGEEGGESLKLEDQAYVK